MEFHCEELLSLNYAEVMNTEMMHVEEQEDILEQPMMFIDLVVHLSKPTYANNRSLNRPNASVMPTGEMCRSQTSIYNSQYPN